MSFQVQKFLNNQ